MVDFPTRHDPNGTENTLDLLLTTHPSWTSDIKPLGGISDHDIVNANISTKTKLEPKPSRKIPLWKGVDTEEFKSCSAQLSSNYIDRVPSAKSVVENWCWFRDTHCKNVSEIVPPKLIKGVNHPPWFTLDLKRMCSKKEKNYNIKPIELAKRRIGRRNCKTGWKIRDSHRCHANDIMDSENPKSFWCYISSRSRDNTGVQPLKVNGKLHTDDQEKAQTLSDQFERVFTKENLDPSRLHAVNDRCSLSWDATLYCWLGRCYKSSS